MYCRNREKEKKHEEKDGAKDRVVEREMMEVEEVSKMARKMRVLKKWEQAGQGEEDRKWKKTTSRVTSEKM